MRPNKTGQIAKFHTPFPDENPLQRYVMMELIEDVERPRARIKALGMGTSLVPTNTVSLDDLEVVEVETSDLIGYKVIIKKADYSQVSGKVVNELEQKIMLDLNKVENGVETNVCLTIEDENGQEHTGILFVN